MADLSIGQVKLVSGNSQQVNAGVNATAGQCVRKSGTQLLLTNAATGDAESQCTGILLQNADSGGVGIFAPNGSTIELNPTPAFVIGDPYVASGAADGGIAPVSDLATGWRTRIVGIAVSGTQLRVEINTTTVTHA